MIILTVTNKCCMLNCELFSKEISGDLPPVALTFGNILWFISKAEYMISMQLQ